uniref:hypothetical protein n=1 Tax=Aliarcobacter sp. TaxID=2321116 RepID=UPI0040489F2C
MTLSKFIKSDMDELYKKHRGKILVIVHKDERIPICEKIMFNSDLCFHPSTKTKYEVLKNKSLSILKRTNQRWDDITKEELDKIISECEEKGYLIVGKENIL